MNIIKSADKMFRRLSPVGKALIALILVLILITIFRKRGVEGFETSEKFTFVEDIYDPFYSEIYDSLVFNGFKNEYEVGQIINSTSPSSHSIILDLGCGTGHHVHAFNMAGYETIGMDNSQAMITRAKKQYPNYNFVLGDMLDTSNFQPSSFTHILCLYFTIYYIKNKALFFDNCYYWLKAGGYLVVHIVNRDMFDPIIPPANPLVMVSPQKYAKKRITTSKVKFEKFDYFSNFALNQSDNTAVFTEKFKNKNNDKTFRMQEHTMYMESEEDILTLARNAGFIVQGKIDLVRVTYEYQYLYIFVKPE